MVRVMRWGMFCLFKKKRRMNFKICRKDSKTVRKDVSFNSLNAKLNPICHLLALAGDRHILHVSRIRYFTG